MKQNEKILAYMQSHGSITTLDAIIDIGVTRLAARIYDLKKEGHNIEKSTVFVWSKNQRKQVAVASYSLSDPVGSIDSADCMVLPFEYGA